MIWYGDHNIQNQSLGKQIVWHLKNKAGYQVDFAEEDGEPQQKKQCLKHFLIPDLYRWEHSDKTTDLNERPDL